jgi:hypothetical protein
MDVELIGIHNKNGALLPYRQVCVASGTSY